MRVLVVSPRFPPTSAADCHRIRLLLPYFAELGCEAEVLAVDARDVASPIDPWLEQRLPANMRVHRVRALPLAGWGLGGLAQRALAPLYRAGASVLAHKRFDLVFFSTTEFLLHLLGPVWRRRFGVPFCMDYQDPWVNDYYRRNPSVVPPGGRIKFALIDRLHRFGERLVAPRCSGFLSVSEPYLSALDARYGAAVAAQPRMMQPFPGEPDEFASLAREGAKQADAHGSSKLIRYIGRGGPDMTVAARAFFSTWRDLIAQGVLSKDALRFEAIGTSYAPAGSGSRTFSPLAAKAGMADLVVEDPERLGYRAMLGALLQSDALVVFGSDDPAYTASKIYPFLLARRPMLAIFHRRSAVVSLMREVGGGRLAVFGDDGDSQAVTGEIAEFLRGVAGGMAADPLLTSRFEMYCAREQASLMLDWFSKVIEGFGPVRAKAAYSTQSH